MKHAVTVMVALSQIGAATHLHAQSIIAQWNFNNTTNTPSIGSGTASAIGGLTATFGSGTGSGDPATAGDSAWNLAGFPSQGKFPGTAGIELQVAATGFKDPQLAFDLRASNTASRRLHVLGAADGLSFVHVADLDIPVGGAFTNGLRFDLASIPGAANASNLTVRIVSEFADGSKYQAISGNYSTAGTWRFDMLTLTGTPITPPPPPTNGIVPIKQLRGMLDAASLLPTDTVTTFRIEGVVTSHTNVAPASTDSLWFVQDATGGIGILQRHATDAAPPAGTRVRVSGSLAHLNGLLVLELAGSNPEHGREELGVGAQLPEPVAFEAALLEGPPALLDALEGSRIRIDRAWLDTGTPKFPGASGGNVNLVLGDGRTKFVMHLDGRVAELIGQPKPVGTVSVTGILGQSDGSDPRTTGYQILPTRGADIALLEAVPVIELSNVIAGATRSGDSPTNSFTELVVGSGATLTLRFNANVPTGGELRFDSAQADATRPPGSQFELRMDGSAASPDANGEATARNVEGELVFAPTQADAGHTSIFQLRARNGSGTNTVSVRIHVPSPEEAGVALTEFLANPTGDAANPGFNPLGRTELPAKDFTVYDEFVELVNLGQEALDLSGWTLGDASAVRHEFAAGTVLPRGEAAVIYGGPLEGFRPSPEAGPQGVLWFPASAGDGLSLNNGGDSISLRNAAGDLVLRVVYASGQLPSQGSMARPSADASFVAHKTLGDRLSSPGTQPDGTAWSVVDPSSIPPMMLQMHLERDAAGAMLALVLRWEVTPGRTYTLFSADEPEGPFQALAMDIQSGEARIPLNPATQTPRRYYRVSVQ